jgi:amino acid adenylation domain-containing protein
VSQIWRWNSIVPPTFKEVCVHDLILQQAENDPHAPAISADDGNTTYGELENLSSRLAQHLISLGVGPDTMVPLCFEKSMWTVVAILGVMRAGGAFVLLDPDSQPEARLREIIQQVGSRFVLTSEGKKILGNQVAENVCVVSEASVSQWPHISDGLAGIRIAPTVPLYVVFTSGSTGRPKGVVITHENYLSGAIPRGRYLGYSNKTRAFDFASYSFDVSIERNLATLLFGGCVCIPSGEARMDVAKSINLTNANVVGLTPSVTKFLKPDLVPRLKMLILGGESAATLDLDLWANKLTLIMIYGPAECSIATTVTTIASGASPHNLGHGIGAVLWIVDSADHERLVPIGEVGELLIEGPIVGRYLNDVQNIEAFVENPKWILEGGNGIPGRTGRLYKTGDLVRYSKVDGTVNFVGRKDTQVKIRGQRVELEEVESHLRRMLPSNTMIAAEVFSPASRSGPNSGEPLLAAFVAIKIESESHEDQFENRESLQNPSILEGHELEVLRQTVSGVNEALAKVVPKYMVPSVFIPISKMPITISRKTDRKKLRQLGSALSLDQLANLRSFRQKNTAPGTDKARVLQHLWSSILNIPANQVGAKDNFFGLGGDSIGAMKLIAAARKIGLSLTTSHVFQHPTLSEMALSMSELSDVVSDYEPYSLLGDPEERSAVLNEVATSLGVSIELLEDALPCTPTQEGLMALSLKRKGVHIVQRVIELGELPEVIIKKIQLTWEMAVASSSVMRTRILQTKESRLMQVVINQPIDWLYGDNLDIYLAEDRQKPMGLGVPLTRYAIINGKTSKQYLVWTAHHAVYDGWSWTLFAERVRDARQDLPLKQPPAYGEFVKFISHPTISKSSEDFWRSELHNFHGSTFPVLPLPSYEPLPNEKLDCVLTLPPHKELNVTPSTVIRTAWSILMKKMSPLGDDDVVFGMSLMGRSVPVPGIKDIEGLTVATVPIRIRVDNTMSVPQFLQAIQEQSTRMIPHEHLGLQNIRRLSGDARTTCEFQTLIVVQPRNEIKPVESAFDKEMDEPLYANTYALTLVCWLDPDGLVIEAIFDPYVLPRVRIQQILRQFKCVMQQIWWMPNVAVGDIDCMTEEDLTQIWQWNTVVPATKNTSVHELITEQTKATPDAMAIYAWDGEFTFVQLDELSSRVAAYLVKNLGVRQEMTVPLLFEKSRWTSVAILGVMKAGGAFVLLDTTLPVARLQTILGQVGREIILTSTQNEPLGSKLALKVVTISTAILEDPPLSSLEQSERYNPAAALYIVFTSGSSGQPKGVVITHANFASGISHRGKLTYPSHPRVLNFASYSFDASIECILSPLILGGCVCEPSEEVRMNNLAAFINESKANVADLTPSVGRLLKPHMVPGLEVLKLAGEAMDTRDIATWCTGTTGIRLMNLYGPAECSVASLAQTMVTAGMDPRNIGRGVGAVVWIVDPSDENHLAPIGAVGELLVEGPIVGQGYVNDVEKTKASFIENPKWLLAGHGNVVGRKGRLYKTGDLACYNLDGTLKFVGRKDTQVKLNGQRLELGDVEHHVRDMVPLGTEVVAELITPESGSSNPVLVAFVAEQRENGITSVHQCDRESLVSILSSLNKRLKEAIPRYMIPSAYVPVEQIPLTAAGKIDRRQLRSKATQLKLSGVGSATKLPVETPKEKILQRVWSCILGLPLTDIGANDNFFHLGGDSIGAMKLVGAVRAECYRGLTVAIVFQKSKLSQMAATLVAEDSMSADSDAEEVSAKSESTIPPFSLLGDSNTINTIRIEAEEQCSLSTDKTIEDIYPCTSMQEGLMEFSLARPGTLMVQNVMELADVTEADEIQWIWERVVASSAILRTCIVRTVELGLVQVVVRQMRIPWVIEDNLETYLARDLKTPIQLGAPLNRFAITINKVTGKCHAIWTAHHTTYDGWSMLLVKDRFQRANRGLRSDLKVEFKNYIKYICDNNRTKAEDYWRLVLKGRSYSIFPDLPATYHPRATEWVQYDVKARRPENSDITMSIMIRAAWAIIVARLSDSKEVLFGATMAGRDAPVEGIEEIEGPTFAIVPIRQRVEYEMTLFEFLQSVHSQRLEMMPYEHIGSRTRRLSEDAQAASAYKTMLAIHPQVINEAAKVVLNELSSAHWYAILLVGWLTSDGVLLRANIDVQVVEVSWMEHILRQMELVMEQFLLNPKCLVKDIKLDLIH